MDINQSLNTILPIIAVKDGIKGKDIHEIIKNLIVIDVGTKFIPFLIARAIGFLRKPRLPKDSFASANDRDKKSSSIEIFRLFDKEHQNDTYDALIWRMCDLPQTKHLKMAVNGYYVIANDNVIKVDEDIFAKQLHVAYDEKKAISESCIEVFSYTMDLLELKQYLNDIVHKYDLHRNNQLGQTLYYFDEVPMTLPHHLDGSINYATAPKVMTFTMAKLITNKCMDNVYGEAMNVVRKRVKFFANNKKWYQDKGVPHTLGILLFGEPGCGKTSLIKALSKDCRRHVFNIKLSDYTTISQINSLFFNERVCVVNEGVNVYYNISIDKRVIILEDIDCLSDIFAPRQSQGPLKQPPKTDSFAFDDAFNAQYASVPSKTVDALGCGTNGAPHPQHSQKLTLSYFLNVLDGVLETPGRIIIMTTNHPERLDPALIRPGRIDLKVHFQRCTRNDIKEMITRITGSDIMDENLEGIPDMQWTPAEVTQKIFERIDEPVTNIIASLTLKN